MTALFVLLSLLWSPPSLPPDASPNVAVEDDLASAETLYREGTSLYEAADYPGAIQKFTAALSIVSRSPDGGAIKRPLLWNIAIAHERAFGIDGDAKHLRKSLVLYNSYVELLAQDETAARSEAMTNIARVEKLLAEQEPPKVPSPSVARDTVPPPVAPSRGQRNIRLGIGLLVPGATSFVTGMVLVGVGSTYEGNAQDQVAKLADLGVPPSDPAWEQGDRFIEQERRKGRALMATGASVGVVGAVLVSVGAYYISRGRRVRLQASPTVGIFGATLGGRF